MTSNHGRRARPAVDEGADYTAEVMAMVKQLRVARGWSAEELAAAMADAGVPWTRDTVVNLENGRRVRLAAHEVLVLAYVLDADSPAVLLVPAARSPMLHITDPGLLLSRDLLRAWIAGKTGPLRAYIDQPQEWERDLAADMEHLTDEDRRHVLATIKALRGQVPPDEPRGESANGQG